VQEDRHGLHGLYARRNLAEAQHELAARELEDTRYLHADMLWEAREDQSRKAAWPSALLQ
jgi:hypothetical protein